METVSRTVATLLLNSLWQVTLVAAMAAMGAWLMRNVPARYRHALWVIALGLSVLVPLGSRKRLSIVRPIASTPVAHPVGIPRASAVVPKIDLPTPPAQAAVRRQPRLPSSRLWLRLGPHLDSRTNAVLLPPYVVEVVLGVYFLFLIYRLARLWEAWRRTDDIRRTAYPRELPDSLASITARCRAALRLGRVSILSSRQVMGPLTLGVRQPAIILPHALFQSASPDDFAAALSHEMAHIARHDFVTNLVYELIFLPVSFHPAARLVKRRIDETRELACDEMAAGAVVTASGYARSLVSLARAMSSSPSRPSLAAPGYTLSVFDANILEERIMKLMDERPRSSPRLAITLLVLGSLLLAATCVSALAFSLSVQTTKAASDEAVLHPNFSGRWQMDTTASDLPSPSPDDLVEVIEQRESRLKITTTSKDWTIEKPLAVTLFALTIPEFSTNTDDQETVQKYGPGELRSKTRWEGKSLVTEWTLARDGHAVVIGTWARSLSADGKTQTVEVKAHDPQQGTQGEAKLVLVKRSDTAAAESFLGTWQAEFQGAKYIVVSLQEGERGPTGTVSLGNFGVDRDGQVNNVNDQPDPAHAQPIVDSRLAGDTLRLTTRSLNGKDHVFEVKASGDSELEVKWSPPPLPPGAPVPGWWKLTKKSENSQNDLMPGGPAGGVVGGVVRGVERGVPGGVAGSITGGVSGGVRVRPAEYRGKVYAYDAGPRRAEKAEDASSTGEPSIANEDPASLSGTVYDPSGARVPGASVVVSILGAKLEKSTTTDQEGKFSFTGLPAGLYYQVEISKPGFALYQQRGLKLDSAKPLPELNAVLLPGVVLQMVEVGAKAPPSSVRLSRPVGPKRIRVGGQVEATRLIQQPKPDYPESVRQRGIEGLVLLEGVISIEGEPLSLKVLASPDPDLSQAALDAVKQWRYQPTLLNGQPVEVVTTIAVQFVLERD